MNNKLFVGNISFASTEGDLLDLFQGAGEVVSCRLIIDHQTNQSRGFAFVEMNSSAAATLAIANLNGRELAGRPLRVSEARSREEHAPADFHQEASARGERHREERQFNRRR